MRFLPVRDRLVHGFQSQESHDVAHLRMLVHALLAEAESDESNSG